MGSGARKGDSKRSASGWIDLHDWAIRDTYGPNPPLSHQERCGQRLTHRSAQARRLTPSKPLPIAFFFDVSTTLESFLQVRPHAATRGMKGWRDENTKRRR